MKWLGLTGGIASGKSSVSDLLKNMGYPVIDADQMARRVVAPGANGLNKVVQAFGREILNADGSLNRKELGRIIFSSPQKREQLEQILHPEIQKLTRHERQSLESEGWPAAFYDVPLLFEKNLQDQFDATLLVYCGVDTQRARLMSRDGLSESETDQRLNAQLPLDQKKQLATYVIDNEGPKEQLRPQLEETLKKLNLPLQVVAPRKD